MKKILHLLKANKAFTALLNKQNIVLLEFNTDKGLSAYCKKDRINCDNAYFGKIGDVLELVCEEYKIKKMIFYVFSLL